MEKIVPCTIIDMQAGIIEILKKQEADAVYKTPTISIDALNKLLKRNFIFHESDLCVALNNLNFNCEIRYLITYNNLRAPGESEFESFPTISAILLGSGKEVS